uniref:ATP synthase F0 subunit 6 n=1 Tax=Lagria rufipennis TaxID=1738060 RepID=UPI002176AAF7|nr:ATP synthase F0 subunit 6 [Lagria rufipennis]UUL71643.1 ATP synthase F0 subunit 6 [Lagria rufipennis]
MNLFSSFDPSSNMNFSLNWLSIMISLLILPMLFWLIPSRISYLFMKVVSSLHNEFKLIAGKNYYGITMLLISLLMFILFNNFLGLFPYIFTSSSHMVFSLSLALPLWLTLMINGWMNNFIMMLAHLVPQGTPKVLMPFMVCIETISNMIRPGTLAIRLSANIIAGHLLMTLLGNTGNMITYYFLSILLMVQIFLLVLESAVSIIQSYVFSILMTLYSSEVN